MYLLPTHADCFRGGRHAHPVDREALEDPAGHPVGEFRSVIGAAECGLEDLPVTEGIRTDEAGHADVQTGREPDHRQIDETAKDVVAKLPGLCAARAGVARGHGCGVDDGDVSGLGGTGDRQADLGGPA